MSDNFFDNLIFPVDDPKPEKKPDITPPVVKPISKEEYDAFNKKLDEKIVEENEIKNKDIDISKEPVIILEPVKPQPPKDQVTWTAEQLLQADFPEPKWIIPDIIPQGLTILAGAPKLGKSWLCLDIAATMSSGGDILGHITIPQTRTLYLCLEDSPRRLKTRLLKQGAELTNNCHLMTTPPKDMPWLLWLKSWMLASPDTAVIIIDTLARFLALQDHNDYSETSAAIATIKRFADEHNIAVILVHHAKKGDVSDFVHSILGSTGISGIADTLLILSRKRGEYEGKLSVTGRDIEEAEYALKFDPNCCKWYLVGNALEVASTHERQNIIDLLKTTNETMKSREIAEALGKKDGAIRIILLRMINDGQIIRTSRGEYKLNILNIKDFT